MIADASAPFPCPFCHADRVSLIGGGLVFLHYRCNDCAEVWTAMAAARPAFLRPAVAAPDREFAPALPRAGRKQKVWPH